MSHSYQSIGNEPAGQQKGTRPTQQQPRYPSPALNVPSTHTVYITDATPLESPQDERLAQTYSLARSVKVLSLVDAILLTLNALFFWGALFFL
jgi:hypothetical protein